MFMREHVPALRELERGSWACLQAIAAHWQAGRMNAFPGQERLAMLSGYDSRSIRVFTKRLEARGVLRVARVKLADGTAHLHYEPGPVLLAGVEHFDAKYSDERAHLRVAPSGRQGRGTVLARPLAAGKGSGGRRIVEQSAMEGQEHALDPAEVASGGRAELASGELSDPRDQKNASSFSRSAQGNAGDNEQRGLNGSEMDRGTAVEALATLRERRFGRGVRLFDAEVITLVAVCVSVIDGDRETKLRAQLDAIDHAFAVSRGEPTPSYIWGSIDHFLHHQTAGQSIRLEQERLRACRARVANEERRRDWEWSRRKGCPPPPEVLAFIEKHSPTRPTP